MSGGEPDPRLEALDHYRRLVDHVDAFFERVHGRHGEHMDCARGCTDCCAPGLTVTAIEGAVIRQLLEALDAEERAALAASAESPPGGRCVALGEDGSCRIYDARPLLCRSHGVPIVAPDPDTRLPVISVCPRNFREHGALEATENNCRLQATGLSMRILAIDSAHADATETARGQRISLADLLR